MKGSFAVLDATIVIWIRIWERLLHMKGHYFEFKIEKDKIFEIMMQNVRYFDLMLTYCKER